MSSLTVVYLIKTTVDDLAAANQRLSFISDTDDVIDATFLTEDDLDMGGTDHYDYIAEMFASREQPGSARRSYRERRVHT